MKYVDAIRSGLAVVYAIGYFALVHIIFTTPIPPENQRAADILIGVMTTIMATVFNFYFSSSVGSKEKTALIGRMSNE